MTHKDLGVPQPPAVACTGIQSRHSAPQRQRESGKENTGTTSEPLLDTKMYAYPALAGLAVCSFAVFLWHFRVVFYVDGLTYK